MRHPLEAAGPLFTEPTPDFDRELRRRADAWFTQTGRERTGGPRALAKAGLFAALGIACWALILAEVTGPLGLWALALVQGTCIFLFALNSAHDATHDALVKSRRLNRVLWYCWDLVGVSSWVTNLNHLRSHHVAPNVAGLDVALHAEVEPLLRLHPDAPHHVWHRAQHLYFPLAYAVGTLHKWFVLDFAELARNRHGCRSGHPEARWRVPLMFAFKLCVLGWALVVPLAVLSLPWWQVLLGFATMHVLPGFIIALTFQVTHISEGLAFPSRRADGRIEGSRALHNFATNSDLLPQSRLLCWLTGGINVHLTHHLFPEVHSSHLPDLALIVEQVAREYGVPYRKQTSLVAALAAHVRWLKRLAATPWRAPAVPLLELVRLAARPDEDRGEVTCELMRHGDLVRLPIPGRRIFFTKNPADFRRILSERTDLYRKSQDYRLLGQLVGDGLLTSEGEVWKRDRRLIQTLFHHQLVAHFVARINAVARQTFERWPSLGGRVCISTEMTRIAVGVIGQRVFSEDVSAHAGLIADVMSYSQRHLAERGFAPVDVARWVPTPARRTFERKLKSLDALFDPIVDRRWALADSGEQVDLLSLLKAGGVSRDSAAAQVRTFFAAGYDTTAASLTWSCHLLAQHPEWQERLAAELRAGLGDREPELADLRRLPQLRAVVDESLRLYPVVPCIGREATQDDVLSGHRVPKGSTVVLCFLAAHRDERRWPDPLRFDPSRFLGGGTNVPWAHLPFGAGPRACIGAQFALLELQLVLAALLRRFELTSAGEPAPKPVPQVSLGLSRALNLRVTQRSALPASRMHCRSHA
ncbi:MAG: cytochrome P450 [Myxococcaceae bacterium]|nr:cytochrome P450 [Myxococcaceae bacterium]